MGEKIRAGVVFSYRTGGIPLTAFSINMTEEVDKDILQRAADKALLRYPYFRCKAKECEGDYYLVDNDLPFVVNDKLISLCGEEANYYLIGICCQKCEIIFSMHHGFCDGSGFMPFIRTVLYYYICIFYNKNFDSTGIRTINDAIASDETVDVYDLDIDPKAYEFKNEDEVPSYVLPETTEKGKHYRWKISFDGKSFYAFSHSFNTGLSSVISLFMAKAVGRVHTDANNITPNIVSDISKALGVPNTYKNTLDSIPIIYSDEIQKLPLEQQLAHFQKSVSTGKELSKVYPRFLRMRGLCDYLDKCPGLAAKQKLMEFSNDLKVNTFSVSYIGRFGMGEMERYIDSASVYGSGTNGMIMEVMSVSESVIVDLMQSFKTREYLDAFCQVAAEHGLNANVEYMGEFETPRCPIGE